MVFDARQASLKNKKLIEVTSSLFGNVSAILNKTKPSIPDSHSHYNHIGCTKVKLFMNLITVKSTNHRNIMENNFELSLLKVL